MPSPTMDVLLSAEPYITVRYSTASGQRPGKLMLRLPLDRFAEGAVT